MRNSQFTKLLCAAVALTVARPPAFSEAGFTSPVSVANTNLVLDKITAQWLAENGTSGSGYGAGDGTFGASKKQSDLTAIIAALNDAGLEAILAPIVQNFPNFNAASDFKSHNSGLRGGLNAAGAASGTLSASVIDWDSLLSWYNVGNGSSFWQTLAPPDYRAAMMALGITPNPLNVYLEVLTGSTWQGTTFTNGLGRLLVVGTSPTYTAGYSVDPTKYAGGFPMVNIASITGSGVVTVSGINQLGIAEIYTYTASTTGRFALVPATTSTDLIAGTTSISVAAGITAISATIEANRPSGRANPPT
jgi:hypothetical protein